MKVILYRYCSVMLACEECVHEMIVIEIQSKMHVIEWNLLSFGNVTSVKKFEIRAYILILLRINKQNKEQKEQETVTDERPKWLLELENRKRKVNKHFVICIV